MEHNDDVVLSDDDKVRLRTFLFNKYVVPHLNLVYKLTANYSFNKYEVEDNYNEVLVNFYKYIETYDPSRSIQTWLHIVTKRFVNDLNKKNTLFKVRETVDLGLIEDCLPDEFDLKENYMTEDNYEQFYNDDILNALNSLKPIYKEVLILQQAGYKLSQIADISYKNGNLKKLNVETIKSRIHLAKGKMRDLINRDGEARIIEKDDNDLQYVDEEDKSEFSVSE